MLQTRDEQDIQQIIDQILEKEKKKKTPAGNGRQHLRGFCSNNSKGYRPINISKLLDKSHSIKLGLCTFGTQ